MSPNQEQLEPCPFCGGEAKIKDHRIGGTGSSGMETPHPYPCCTKCQARLPAIPCDDWPYGQANGALTYKQARAEAIAAWNTRATTLTSLSEENERLRKALAVVKTAVEDNDILGAFTVLNSALSALKGE